MVSVRKRALRDAEPEVDPPQPSLDAGPLQRIRNSWQFANLFQWIYLFGAAVKIDDSIEVDDLEAECLKPQSTVLADIGLALLKAVSSHRGLTRDLFNEYTRRQYVAKAPDRNPFGTDESPANFNDFDALLKIRVLQQLTQWVMLHPERIREKMDEQKPSDQTEWRIEPTGWDSEDRTYYILDDNRLYRMTPAPPTVPTWKPKKNTKKAKAAARATKRRRTLRQTAQSRDAGDEDLESGVEDTAEPEDDGLGGAKWECIGVSLDDIRGFLATIRNTRDGNEKILKDAIEAHLLPILEKQEESRKRKLLQRQKELLNLEKMAHAKRSSRIANKAEQHRQLQQAKEDEEKRQKEEEAARKEEQKRLKLEREHDKRAKLREARLKERQIKRLQHEEELAQLSESSKSISGDGRISERRLKAQIAKKNQILQELEDEADDWIFDCVCGVYGQVDDGTHSVACEKCNVWQHSKCIGVSEDEADRDDFHFVCKRCRLPQQPVTKIKITGPGISSTSRADNNGAPVLQPTGPVQRDTTTTTTTSTTVPSLPKTLGQPPAVDAVQRAQVIDPSPLSAVPRPSGFPSIPIKPAGQAHVPLPPTSHANGLGGHAFSSTHPALVPPEQSPNKSRAYSTLFSNSSSSTSSSHTPSPGQAQAKLPQTGIFPPARPKSLQESANRNPLAMSIPSAVSVQTPNPASATQGQRNVLSTPQLDRSVFGANDATPSLPPSRNGISPTKRSPQPHHFNGARSSPVPAILPPVPNLPPSPSQQHPMSPVKFSDPPMPGSRRSSSFGGDM
ncbi:hypothetical protein GGR50DRAFT_239275 [Xylaria sp. CBS 124048]|nr:hypothetical protein GGR50DRAFT_239275 [Xylaria sp. CBS 124048]